jgi:uncharacterized small protein (DUF1192 family)
MKLDLMESEEAKANAPSSSSGNGDFSELERKLREVEKATSENKQRDAILAAELRRTQANIYAKNATISGVLRDVEDDP